jgi:RNA polymerase-binding transcription factor DksA
VPDRWRWHHDVLRGLRDRLLDERAGELEAAREALEPHSQDTADSATDEFDHDLALAFLSHHQDALEEIGGALGRIGDGTYGVCEESGDPIPDVRLRAVPWTRYTREVAERIESEGRVPHTRLPGAASLQGPPPGGLAQAGDPEDEYAQAQAREQLKRRAAARAIEQGEGEEEGGAAAPSAAETGEEVN